MQIVSTCWKCYTYLDEQKIDKVDWWNFLNFKCILDSFWSQVSAYVRMNFKILLKAAFWRYLKLNVASVAFIEIIFLGFSDNKPSTENDQKKTKDLRKSWKRTKKPIFSKSFSCKVFSQLELSVYFSFCCRYKQTEVSFP